MMADRTGQHIGKYQLLRLIGEGGFAEVYLGEHIHLGTQAAIKLLHAQLVHNEVDKFRGEARNVARLLHPNIVRVLDFDVEDRTPYLVMDYASRGTLRQLHEKGQAVPLATVVSYVKQIADALQCAHDEKLIHRDVKPENILVSYLQHHGAISGVTWSPNGKYIASSSADKTVHVWEASGRTIGIHSHTAALRAVAWSPDGKYIASGGDDKIVQVWVAPS